MRVAQYKILKEILEKIEVPDYIHAFEKGKSIPEMAALHVNKQVVISLDLKDYFTSIKQYHLQQLFEHLGFGPHPARTLSELCTYKSYVPQGALTSPKVSNIITSLTFGPIVRDYCDQHGLTLSIYADDITISSDTKLDGTDGKPAVGDIIRFVSDTVRRYAFRLNREKIKVMYRHNRQWVCGTVVNEKVNMLKSERYRLRAIVHNCAKNGIEAEAAKNGLRAGEFSAQILGKLNWFSQLNDAQGTSLKTKFMKICEEQGEPTVADVVEQAPTDNQPQPEVTEPAVAPW